MKKNIKVRKMIDQNGLQVDNYTMVIRLKKIVQQLHTKIEQQNQQIMQLKRDSKTTKIYEMQVQIQHLNDENKRLVIMIEQLKLKHKQQKVMLIKNNNFMKTTVDDNYNNISKADSKSILLMNNTNSTKTKTTTDSIIRAHTIKKTKKSPPSSSFLFGGLSSVLSYNNLSSIVINNHKKSYPEVQKQKEEQLKQQLKQKKFQKKYYQLLQETEKIKKELINTRLNQPQSLTKKQSKQFLSHSNTNNFDKTYSSFIEKSIESLQRMTQKKNDLQVQNDILKNKLINNQKSVKQLYRENDEIKGILSQLQAQIKRKNLFNSDKRANKKMPTLFMDLSNNNISMDSSSNNNNNSL